MTLQEDLSKAKLEEAQLRKQLEAYSQQIESSKASIYACIGKQQYIENKIKEEQDAAKVVPKNT